MIRMFNHRIGTIRCPHCREVVSPFRLRRRRYGIPLRVCPYCKEVFLDKDRIEPALAPRGFATVPLGHIVMVLVALSNFYLVFSSFFRAYNVDIGLIGVTDTIQLAFTYDKDRAFVGVLFLALGIYGVIRSLSYRPTPKEVKRSRERLSYPKYVLALDEAGYDVPRELLDKSSTELMYGYEDDNDPLKRLINNINNKNNQK